ncbi:hypothetical protein E8L99_19730 [Phreatobacter aquaticus]|uniref:Uncharacterized protein n=1 Tax=Phreatobacter aquaticus TaxID=2570229 RepID=A0A4D7QRE9_9HYPH|nr:hypothetical protein [Phreatobacter aquaticus]QCK87824.1 hypothetical protein E8L99_19730 [Phreatobacter aquaticus]
MIVVLLLASIAIGIATAALLWSHGILLALLVAPVVTSVLVFAGAVLIAYRQPNQSAESSPLSQAVNEVLTKLHWR